METSNLTKKEYRKFGITMSLFICLIFGLVFPWLYNAPAKSAWIIAALIMLWAIVLPNTLVIIYKPWMYLAHILGLINTKIILAVIFYLIFTPTALLLKLLGKDAMDRQFKNESTPSYWKESSKQPNRHMENIY